MNLYLYSSTGSNVANLFFFFFFFWHWDIWILMGKRISSLTWRQFKIPNKGAGEGGHTDLMASTVVALSVWVRTSTMPTSSPRPNSLTSSFLPPTDVITDRSRPVRTMKILSLVSACLETETNPVRYWDEFENKNRPYFAFQLDAIQSFIGLSLS